MGYNVVSDQGGEYRGGGGGGGFDVGGAIGAGIGAAATVYGAHTAANAQRASNEMNYKIWQEQRDWQGHLAANAHTIEVADLRKAGLNPILTATGGKGAPVPNPTAPTMQPVDAWGKGITSAAQNAISNLSTLVTTASQAKKADADAKLAHETALNKIEERPDIKATSSTAAARAAAVKADAAATQATREFDKKSTKWDGYVNRGLKLINGAADILTGAGAASRLLKGLGGDEGSKDTRKKLLERRNNKTEPMTRPMPGWKY